MSDDALGWLIIIVYTMVIAVVSFSIGSCRQSHVMEKKVQEVRNQWAVSRSRSNEIEEERLVAHWALLNQPAQATRKIQLTYFGQAADGSIQIRLKYKKGAAVETQLKPIAGKPGSFADVRLDTITSEKAPLVLRILSTKPNNILYVVAPPEDLGEIPVP